jgi:WD40 repeat protein
MLIPALIIGLAHADKVLRLKRHRQIAHAAFALVDAGDAFTARRLLTEAVPEGDWTAFSEEPEVAWALFRAMEATEGRIHLPGPLTDMAVTDSATILTLSYSVPYRKEILREWNPETGMTMLELDYDVQTNLGNGYERVFVFSPDGTRIVSECGTLFDTGTFSRILDMEDGPHWLSAISFSPDGRAIAAREHGDLAVWDAGTGERIVRVADAFAFKPHILREYSTLFSPDGRFLAFTPSHRGVGVVCLDGPDVTILPATDSVRLWNTRVYDPGKVQEASRLFGFSSDSRTLLTRDEGNGIRAWDPTSGRQVTVSGEVSDSISALTAGNGLVRQVDDNTLAVRLSPPRRLPSRVQSRILPSDDVDDSPWSEGIVLKAISPDGKHQAFVKGTDTDEFSLYITDVLTGKDICAGATGKTDQLEFSPDGSRLLDFNPDSGSMILFDSGTGRKTAEWVTPGCIGYAFCLRRKLLGIFDGTNLISVRDYDGRVKGSFTPDAGEPPINAISFSPDGETIACAGMDGTLVLWDVASGGKRVLKGLTGDVLDVCFSRDGALMSSLSDSGMVHLWSPSSGRCYGQVQFPEQSGLVRLRFNTSGTALVATSPCRETWRWDLPNFRALARELWFEYGGNPLSKEESKRIVQRTVFQGIE